jgi:hypothetical protein
MAAPRPIRSDLLDFLKLKNPGSSPGFFVGLASAKNLKIYLETGFWGANLLDTGLCDISGDTQ